jgi:glycerol-3-phosphate dehydrogenase (NAD(P)+)
VTPSKPTDTPPAPERRPAPGGHAGIPTHRIAILGVGQMGLVCSAMLVDAARATASPVEIVLWGHSEDEAGALSQTRSSPRLPGFELPERVRVARSDAEALAGASLVVSAVPVQFMRSVWERLRSHTGQPEATSVVSVAKGIENTTLLRPTQIVGQVLADDPDARPRPIGVLSGPTIAAELARFLPATMVAASDHPGFAARLQATFSTSWLRVYTNEDTLGVELAGAIKNVIAIAAGILDGLDAGNNAKSALLARGVAEIARLGAAMGASRETFFGIAGVGDLATSCFSPEGRNRSCGEALGRGTPLTTYLESSRGVVEGVATTRSVRELASRHRVEMPIVEAVHAVLFEGLDPIDGIGRLMSRGLKPER